MAAKLKSVSTNQILRLAFRAFLISLTAFWARSTEFQFLYSVLFVAIFIFFYTRPPLQSAKFFPSAVGLILLPFFAPPMLGGMEIIADIALGVLFFFMLGVKNLLILKRFNAYRVFHFSMIAIVSALLFIEFDIISQIIVFVFFLFLFREFYLVFLDIDKKRLTLASAAESLIVIEASWIIFFLPINFLVSAVSITLLSAIMHDIFIHYFKKSISKKIVIRSISLLSILIVGIAIFSS